MSALPSPPSPWKVSVSEPPARRLADLFAAIDRHASVLLAKHPNLLIPGTGIGGYAAMGPFTARSLITLWREHSGWFAGTCPVCGGAARGVHATGLLTIGGIEGICLSCGMQLARFAGGICRILEIIPERLRPRVTRKNLDPSWAKVLLVLGRLGEVGLTSSPRARG